MQTNTYKYRVVGTKQLEGENPAVPLQQLVGTDAINIDTFVAVMEEAGFKHTGYSHHAHQRAELQGQPTFDGLAGAMWDGDAIRYETWDAYNILSA